jgi:hypothetical protein
MDGSVPLIAVDDEVMVVSESEVSIVGARLPRFVVERGCRRHRRATRIDAKVSRRGRLGGRDVHSDGIGGLRDAAATPEDEGTGGPRRERRPPIGPDGTPGIEHPARGQRVEADRILCPGDSSEEEGGRSEREDAQP